MSRREHILTGLRASDPLAFMAALGCLRALHDRDPDSAPRLGFRHLGYWHPVLWSAHADIDAIIADLLADAQHWRSSPCLGFSYTVGEGKKAKSVRDIKPPPEQFRAFARSVLDQTSADRRDQSDMLSAWATSVAVDGQGATKPTALHFTAGQQRFLELIGKLLDGSKSEPGMDADDLRDALIGPWPYRRKLPILGWEGGAERLYALRATDPSPGKDKYGNPGADWLAMRSMPCFQAVPRGSSIVTTGCTGSWKKSRFQWPLWTEGASAAAIACLLRADDWPTWDEVRRRARGIAVVFESRIARSDQGGYGSFSPSRPVEPSNLRAVE